MPYVSKRGSMRPELKHLGPKEWEQLPDGSVHAAFGLFARLDYEAEEAECAHMVLDDLNVPKDDGEQDYSLVGRIKWALANLPIDHACRGGQDARG